MTEAIDEIINSLNKIKGKQDKENESDQIIKKFKRYKASNEEYTQNIVERLKEIEKNIKEFELSKKEFFDDLEEYVDPERKKKPYDKRVKRFYTLISFNSKNSYSLHKVHL